MKDFLLLMICVILFSCQKENGCTKKYRDARLINELFVIQDTCNKMEGYFHESYYFKDKLIMEGYGDRIIKQGIWVYYDNGEKIAEGLFKNSNPIGIWNYKNTKSIDWGLFEDVDEGYRINIPKEWVVYNEYTNSVSIVNDTIPENFNIKIDVNIGTINLPIEDWANNQAKHLKKSSDGDVKFKSLNLFESNIIGYEFEFTREFADEGIYKINEIVLEFNNKIYMVTGAVKKESNYSNKVIKEQILRSFKFVKN